MKCFSRHSHGLRVTIGRQGAFSLIELLAAVVVLSILVTIAVTRLDTSASQAEAAARDFLADVAYAQAAAIARPDRGCLIRVDMTNHRYWLAQPSSPATPMTHPITTKPYSVQLSTSNQDKLSQVRITSVSFGGDSDLVFDAFGAPDQATSATIDFTAGSTVWRVTIEPFTGIATAARTSG